MEIWRAIEGYEGLYEISSEGNVRSLNFKNGPSRRILKPIKDAYGYYQVSLYKGKAPRTYKIHRLVAMAFIPNPDNLPQVNHKNENKTDNRIQNLEWISHIDNQNYGSHNKKVAAALSKEVFQIEISTGNIVKEWSSVAEAGRNLNFGQSHISKCCLGKQKTAYGYIWKYKE